MLLLLLLEEEPRAAPRRDRMTPLPVPVITKADAVCDKKSMADTAAAAAVERAFQIVMVPVSDR